MKLWAVFLLFASVSFSPAMAYAGDAMTFACKPMYMPEVQGEERFARIEFRADGSAYLGVSEMAGPFKDASAGRKFEHAYYSHNESSAGASWRGGDGSVADVSLVFFGAWWGAMIHFEGQELEMKCYETES